MNTGILTGASFAFAAGLMWGLIFVAPLLLPEYPATLLTFGRYLAFGLIAIPLAWLDRAQLQQLARADWIEAASKKYGLDPACLLAVGFSNGANIAATILQLRPATLGGGVLIRPMVVLDQPAAPASLAGKRVLLLNGTVDPIVPADQPPHLANLLRAGGAEVTQQFLPASHNLTPGDVSAAQAWLSGSKR